MQQKRILSGIQPSGKLHLGNLIGAVENWVELQNDYQCFFFIADIHALTTGYEKKQNISDESIDVMIDLLSSGINPEKSTVFLQSLVPEHSELHLLFSMITPLSWLERIPTYKSKINELSDRALDTYGFLGYPVLQAADILIYKADFVPVGQDQLPHLELTREIARRFNSLYGTVFPLPQEKLTKYSVLHGLDGRKMSKSYGNTIAISDSPTEILNKVKNMITDPARVRKEDKGNPDVCTVFSYYKIFGPEKQQEISSACRSAAIGCVECKRKLAECLAAFLSPITEKRAKLEKERDKVIDIMIKGSDQARKEASETLRSAKSAMGLFK
jgi:tryptophanyl-tRNA synthetase